MSLELVNYEAQAREAVKLFWGNLGFKFQVQRLI